MKIFTIGFTQKKAEDFFNLIGQNGVKRLVDIRLNPEGQLSGFAKQGDLSYFLSNLSNGCQYEYVSELAPTKEILNDYRNDKNWEKYEARFEALMDDRKVPNNLDRSSYDALPSCFLCSEPTPEKCHRRLVAERLAKYWPEVEIIHL